MRDFVYDSDGRILNDITSNSITGWSNVYLYFGGQLVAQYTGGPTGNTYFVHQDHLNSTRFLTVYPLQEHVHSQWFNECDDYLPFGEQNACETALSTTTTTHKFTSKELDSESSLYNFSARHNAAGMGRFLSPDLDNAGATGDDPQSWNGYAYARNNPLIYADPDGRVYQLCNADGACQNIPNRDYNNYFRDAKNVVTIGGDNGGIIFQYVDGKWQQTGTYQKLSDDPVTDADRLDALAAAGQMASAPWEAVQHAYSALQGWEERHPNIVGIGTLVGAYIAGGDPEEAPVEEPTEPGTSTNQMNQQVMRGQAPGSIIRVDRRARHLSSRMYILATAAP